MIHIGTPVQKTILEDDSERITLQTSQISYQIIVQIDLKGFLDAWNLFLIDLEPSATLRLNLEFWSDLGDFQFPPKYTHWPKLSAVLFSVFRFMTKDMGKGGTQCTARYRTNFVSYWITYKRRISSFQWHERTSLYIRWGFGFLPLWKRANFERFFVKIHMITPLKTSKFWTIFDQDS